MKIGILTLPLHINYGGILQAYALQTVLERMGHEVHVIEKKYKPLRLPIYKIPLCYGKRIAMNLLGHKTPVFYERKYNREQPVVRQNTDKFIHKYIHFVQYDDFSDIKESEYDVIVVGSDQVWRPKYFGINIIEQAYLKFAEDWNIKRIAYAASFGTDEWEYSSQQTEACGRLLKKFDAVSLREESGVELCKQYFGVDAYHVLDPTMLLDKEDYIKLFTDAHTPKSKGNLLCYILDETEEKKAFIKRFADERGLIPFRVNSKVENKNASLSERIQPPVEQWLRGFYDASLIVTDSFHACVFSILFNKNFFVFPNETRGTARIQSLLSSFHISNRMIGIDNTYMEASIDWNEINLILKKEKGKFLTAIKSII